MPNSSENNRLLAGLISLAVIYGAIFATLASVALENHFMVRAFDTDESGKLYELYKMYDTSSWQPLTYLYGTAHTYLALLLSHILSLIKTVTFLEVAVIGRLVNFLSLLGTGLLFMRYGRSREYPKWFFLFLFSLFFIAVNFRYAINAKPEHLQVLFIACSIFCLQAFFERQSLKSLYGAGLFSGLAFATKYAGGVLLGFEVVCLLWFVLSHRQSTGKTKMAFGWLSLLFVGGVCGVALLGPYLLIDFRDVLQLLFYHSKVLGAGFIMTGQRSWYDWFGVLFGSQILWWGLALWLVPVVIWTIKVKRTDLKTFPTRAIGILWVVFYMVYMCVAFREMSPRFLVVIVPFLLDYLFAGLGSIEEWLKSRARHGLPRLMYALVLLAVISTTANSWQIVSDIRTRPESKRIKAGEWLSENVHHSSLIVYDFYTYVPPEFSRRFHQPYLTGYDVISTQPAYIVSSPIIMSRYLDMSKAEHYRGGQDAFMRHYYLYSKLNTDSFPGFHLIKDFGEVRIYKNSRLP